MFWLRYGRQRNDSKHKAYALITNHENYNESERERQSNTKKQGRNVAALFHDQVIGVFHFPQAAARRRYNLRGDSFDGLSGLGERLLQRGQEGCELSCAAIQCIHRATQFIDIEIGAGDLIRQTTLD